MTTDIQTIDAGAFADKQRQGQTRFLLDVRSPAEFRAEHVAGARNVPLDQLQPEQLAAQLKADGLQRGDELYLLCQSGMRARKAAEQLKQLLPGVRVIDGGTNACVACGVATNKAGSAVISIQRQVQITAGSLVLLGVILGATVSPAWFGLSAFVGAGLTFAGISNTCAMALLLARMPWNK